jgi:flagellar assembly protein FliH
MRRNSLPDLAFSAIEYAPISAATTPTTTDAAARDRGYAAGYAAGARRAEEVMALRLAQLEQHARENQAYAAEQLAAAVALLAEASAALSRTVLPILEEAESTLFAAACDLAETVLGGELATGDTSARAALKRLLGHVDSGSIAVIRMNPVDIDLLGEDAGPSGVFLEPDSSLARGDAVAELPVGIIDARINSALDRARKELLGEWQ